MRRLALGLVFALFAAGCGGDDGAEKASPPPSPFAYDDSAPLRLAEGSSAQRDGLVERELSFAVAGGPPVAATLVARPGAQAGAGVVYLHGAGGSRDDMLPLARRVARRGAVALSLDQPEPGAAESRLSGIAALEAQRRVTARAVVAVRRALDLLVRSENVDAARLGVAGWSGGARLAALAAGAEPRLDAAVLMSAGALPVSRYVAAAPPELRGDVRRILGAVDPLRWLKRARAGLLLQDGRRDEIVPREALVTLANAAPPGRDLRWYSSGHALNERAYADQVDWLARRLRLGR